MRHVHGLGPVVAALAAASAHAQLDTIWSSRYDVGVSEWGYVTAADAESIYVVCQAEDEFGDNDIITMRYAPDGTLLWADRYTPGDTFASSIQIDPDGHAVVLAESVVEATGNDFLLIEYDRAGTRQYETRYDAGAGADDRAGYVSLAIDPKDGASYCTGAAVTPDLVQKMCLLKFDTDGALVWDRFHDSGNSYDVGYAVDLDSSGNAYMVGSATSFSGAYTSDFVTIKYDSTGNEIWRRETSLGERYEFPWWLDVNGDRVVVSGEDHAEFGAPGDAYVVVYDLDGTEIYEHTHAGAAGTHDAASFALLDDAGNVYLVGTEGDPWGGSYYLVQKLGTTGDVLWTRTYQLWTDTAYLWAGVLDSDGDLYVTGYAWGGWESGYDAVTLQYAPDGTLIDEHVYDGPSHGNDVGSWVAVGPGDEIYVTVWSGGTGGFDAVTMRLGERAAGDVDADGTVDITDLLAVLSSWGPCVGCAADLDGDGVVGVSDLLVVLANWSV